MAYTQNPGSKPAPSAAAEQIDAKLDRIMLPEMKLNAVPLSDAINQIRVAAGQADTVGNPDERGVNIFLKVAPTAQKRLSNVEITLDLKPALLRSDVKAMAEQANLEMKVDAQAVVLRAVN